MNAIDQNPEIISTAASRLIPDDMYAALNRWQRTSQDCAGSAAAFGTPLCVGMKSLVYRTKNGIPVVANIPGDTRVEMSALTREMGERMPMLKREELHACGLEPFRVNPFVARHYLGPDVIQLVDEELLNAPMLFTNRDSLSAHMGFEPRRLTKALDAAEGFRLCKIAGPRSSGPQVLPDPWQFEFVVNPRDFSAYRHGRNRVLNWLQANLPLTGSAGNKAVACELLSNIARHAAIAPCRAKVSWQPLPGAAACLRIEDDGCGMDTADSLKLQHRFEAPWRKVVVQPGRGPAGFRGTSILIIFSLHERDT